MKLSNTNQSLGIAIADQKIYAVILEENGSKKNLKGFAKKDLPEQSLILGKPITKNVLEKSIADLVKVLGREARLSGAVSLAIPESHVFVHSFLYHEASGSDKQTVVYDELAKVLPIDIANLQISFAQEQDKITAVAVEKTNLEVLINGFRESGIQVDKANTESICVARAIQENNKNNLLIIDVGEFRSYVTLFDSNGLAETVLLSVRPASIHDAIANRFNVSEKSATLMRKTSGLDPASGRGEVCMFLQDELAPMREELTKTIKRFSEKSKTKLKKAIILGSIADTPSLGEYIQKAIGVRVELADSWRDIENVPKHIQRESDYTAALGAALYGLDADNVGINLINSETKAEMEITADAGIFKRALWRLPDIITQSKLYVTRSRERVLIVVALGVFVVAVMAALATLLLALR